MMQPIFTFLSCFSDMYLRTIQAATPAASSANIQITFEREIKQEIKGGTRMIELSQLFHTAVTLPVMS